MARRRSEGCSHLPHEGHKPLSSDVMPTHALLKMQLEQCTACRCGRYVYSYAFSGDEIWSVPVAAVVQVALADTQQQLASQRDLQDRTAAKTDRPDHADSVSPQKLLALQQSMHDIHAEIANQIRTDRPENADSISNKKISALQQSMNDMHDEVAELRSTLYQKDTELDMLHRSEQPDALVAYLVTRDAV